MSIWELRNPYMLELFAKTIYEMHTNQDAADAIEAIRPMNRSQLGIDISIDVWGPGSILRIASIRKRLNPETVPDHDIILRALDDLENTYLKPGF